MAVMSTSSRRSPGQRLGAFFELCKPRVNSLIVFTAMIGMFLAPPSFPPFALFVAASVGIALVAGAAAAINCLIEQDTSMPSWRERGHVRRPGAKCRRLRP
jgi:protoheme IX farnesyltransferase